MTDWGVGADVRGPAMSSHSLGRASKRLSPKTLESSRSVASAPRLATAASVSSLSPLPAAAAAAAVAAAAAAAACCAARSPPSARGVSSGSAQANPMMFWTIFGTGEGVRALASLMRHASALADLRCSSRSVSPLMLRTRG